MSGHIPQSMGPSMSEPSGTLLAEDRRAADQVVVSAGSQEHGQVSPSHGAAGGHDIVFWTEGASGSSPEGSSGSAGTPFD